MKTNALDSLIETLNTANSMCDHVGELVECSLKLMKQTNKYIEQHAALSLPSVESCPLSKIPGYLPKLRGCIAGKINSNIMGWKKNRTAMCGAAEEVVDLCAASERVYRAGRPLPAAQPRPCQPGLQTLLQTAHDCRQTFSQLLHILLVEEENFTDTASAEIGNILRDLDEVQVLLKNCQVRLQICEPALQPMEDEGDDNVSR